MWIVSSGGSTFQTMMPSGGDFAMERTSKQKREREEDTHNYGNDGLYNTTEATHQESRVGN